MKKTGETIKYYREIRGMTQQELAAKARLGKASIEKYETGEIIPDTASILKLSTVLDVPASELLEHSSPAAPGYDQELDLLIKKAGVKKAKLVLRKINEISEEDFLKVMQMLFEKKNKKSE
ncbi:helix-turn-helix domain-containing protein [Metabacillus sp. 84]|uniref:helix-turn-helix domain-containing protein n=1 Tax=unclassified Metabacillus TaxID=2675274 RepID=UPI003CEEBF01